MSIFSPHSRFSSKAPRAARGFTLVELMVVIAIMTILTTVMVLQQKRFDSSTLLRSLAYSVALSVRQAQLYGTSVRQFDTSASGFSYNYGVYFSSDPSNYYLFADVNGDGNYQTTEKVQQFKLNGNYTITDFCGIKDSANQSCQSGGVGPLGSAITRLTIYFKRPNPDAKFTTNVAENYCGAYIVIKGPGTDYRTVKVTSTGQIQIGNISSPVSGC